MDSKTIIKALELVIEDEVARRDMNQPAFTAKEGYKIPEVPSFTINGSDVFFLTTLTIS